MNHLKIRPHPQVLLIEDHALVRDALGLFLNANMSLSLGETSYGLEALTMLAQRPWDMVILDLTLPDIDGLELLKKIKSKYPDLPVLILTMHNDDKIAQQVYKMGASGYCCKDQSCSHFISAIHRVLNGEQYFNQVTTQYFVHKEKIPTAISAREAEILQLLSTGKSQTNIAIELGISLKTVNTYRSRLLKKLGLKNTAALLLHAMHHPL